MTSIIENNSVQVAMTSDVSEFVGPDELTPPLSQTQGSRITEEFVKTDTVDYSSRLIQYPAIANEALEFIPFGPGETNSFVFNPLLQAMIKINLFRNLMLKYSMLSYKSIKVRISVSDPKGIAGAAHVGWYPWVDWYDKNTTETFNVQISKDLLKYGLINGPNTHLLCYGASQDVSFEIPWTYKFPAIPCWAINFTDNASLPVQDRRALYGTPVIWGLNSVSAYVNSTSLPAKVRVYYQFEDLRWYGPSGQSFTLQSGAGVAAGVIALETATAAIAGAAAGTLGEILQGSPDHGTENASWQELASSGTYESPQAVQMAYLGDISSIGPPSVSPIFTNGIPLPGQYQRHDVKSFISRPQLIFEGVSTATAWDNFSTIYGNPMRPIGKSDWSDSANYLRYFGMLNRWWRGTLYATFVIFGHPMVEVEFQAVVLPSVYGLNGSVIQRQFDTPTHTSVFSGSKRIEIPMPFLTPLDHLPVSDDRSATPAQFSSSKIIYRMRILSTMLSIQPTIYANVYMHAGPDFEFEQPRPPGLLHTEFDDAVNVAADPPTLTPMSEAKVSSPDVKREKRSSRGKRKEKLQLQVFLPFEEDKEVVEGRASALASSSIHPVLKSIEDYLSIWSRSVSFADYENQPNYKEPIPDATVGFSYATWYPPIDRSEDLDSNNSWYFTLDYVAYFSMMFVLFRGSLGVKVVQSLRNPVEVGMYKYIALGDSPDAPRQTTHCPFAYSDANMPDNSNPGTGSAITPTSQQPVLETTIPYRGSSIWSLSIEQGVRRGVMKKYDVRNCDVWHNVTLVGDEDPLYLEDAVFRKAGSDFALCVETLLPPPTMWIARGYHWS